MNVLVIGGSGWVGRHVVRRLALLGDDVRYTWRTEPPDLPGCGHRLELLDEDAIPGLFAELDGWHPDAVVHAAGVRAALPAGVSEATAMEAAVRIHAGTVLAVCRELDARPSDRVRNVVAFGALDRAQSFPVPPAFAAAQGALTATVMALGHELGGRNIRVNVVALGVLDGGAADAVPRSQVETYTRFAALRRVGTAEEAAATAVWLARENRVINGKVLAANGGI